VTTFNCLIASASDSGSYPALLEIGSCLATAEPDVRACCMNSYVSGLFKVGRGDRGEGWHVARAGGRGHGLGGWLLGCDM